MTHCGTMSVTSMLPSAPCSRSLNLLPAPGHDASRLVSIGDSHIWLNPSTGESSFQMRLLSYTGLSHISYIASYCCDKVTTLAARPPKVEVTGSNPVGCANCNPSQEGQPQLAASSATRHCRKTAVRASLQLPGAAGGYPPKQPKRLSRLRAHLASEAGDSVPRRRCASIRSSGQIRPAWPRNQQQ